MVKKLPWETNMGYNANTLIIQFWLPFIAWLIHSMNSSRSKTYLNWGPYKQGLLFLLYFEEPLSQYSGNDFRLHVYTHFIKSLRMSHVPTFNLSVCILHVSGRLGPQPVSPARIDWESPGVDALEDSGSTTSFKRAPHTPSLLVRCLETRVTSMWSIC